MEQIGRRIVQVNFGLIIAAELWLLQMNLSNHVAIAAIATQIARCLLTGALLCCVWRGYFWAKWLMVLLMAAVAVAALSSGHQIHGGRSILIGIVSIAIATSLMLPPVDYFLREQKQRNQAPKISDPGQPASLD